MRQASRPLSVYSERSRSVAEALSQMLSAENAELLAQSLLSSKATAAMIANTPAPPYYAVIFTSLRTEEDEGYQAMAELMAELAAKQPGYLGIESARSGLGITISYWSSLEAVQAWKENVEHTVAQQRGKDVWYRDYCVRICKVERAYSFSRSSAPPHP